MDQQFSLSEVLAHISEELVTADESARARGKAAMQFEECEVEFAVKLEGGVKAGIKVWVLELGANAKRSDTNTIRVKFKSLPNRPLQAPHVDTSAPGPELTRETSNQS